MSAQPREKYPQLKQIEAPPLEDLINLIAENPQVEKQLIKFLENLSRAIQLIANSETNPVELRAIL